MFVLSFKKNNWPSIPYLPNPPELFRGTQLCFFEIDVENYLLLCAIVQCCSIFGYHRFKKKTSFCLAKPSVYQEPYSPILQIQTFSTFS